MVLDGLIPALLILAVCVYMLAMAGCLKDWLFFTKLMAAISAFVFLTNVLVARMGGAVFWEYGPVPLVGTLDVTSEEVMFSVGAVARLLAVTSAFLLLTLTVSPDELFAFARRRLPGRTGLLLTLTAVLYPAALRNASEVAEAHMARGLEMEKGSIWSRLRSRRPLLRPMFNNAMERSSGLAEAMAARGWGCGGRGRKGGHARRGGNARDGDNTRRGGNVRKGGHARRGSNAGEGGHNRRIGNARKGSRRDTRPADPGRALRSKRSVVNIAATGLLYASAVLLLLVSIFELVLMVTPGGVSVLCSDPAQTASMLSKTAPVLLSPSPADGMEMAGSLSFLLFLAACMLASIAPSLGVGNGHTTEHGNGGVGNGGIRELSKEPAAAGHEHGVAESRACPVPRRDAGRMMAQQGGDAR